MAVVIWLTLVRLYYFILCNNQNISQRINKVNYFLLFLYSNQYLFCISQLQKEMGRVLRPTWHPLSFLVCQSCLSCFRRQDTDPGTWVTRDWLSGSGYQNLWAGWTPDPVANWGRINCHGQRETFIKLINCIKQKTSNCWICWLPKCRQELYNQCTGRCKKNWRHLDSRQNQALPNPNNLWRAGIMWLPWLSFSFIF